jgi:hypothetical protein
MILIKVLDVDIEYIRGTDDIFEQRSELDNSKDIVIGRFFILVKHNTWMNVNKDERFSVTFIYTYPQN